MNAFLSLGRWVFPMPFAVFGLLNLMNAPMAAGVVPNYMPAPVLWVYISSGGMVAAAVAMYIGRYDKLAATLLAVVMLLFILMIHLPGVLAGDEGGISMSMLLKDLGLAAGAKLYALHVAKDRSVIG